MEDAQNTIQNLADELFGENISVELIRTEIRNGDYATNIALKLANATKQNPKSIAQKIIDKMESLNFEWLESCSVADPGFINIRLSNIGLQSEIKKVLEQGDNYGQSDLYKNKNIVAEYSDPNPFKVMHAGHLYTFVVGDAIANLLEAAGATVHSVNFGGDVGLHVGKSMWGILEKLGGENPKKLKLIEKDKRADWISEAYVVGSSAYEDDEKAKPEIIALNKRIYSLIEKNDKSSNFAQIYWTCRQWSYDYFDDFYARINSRFTLEKQKGERVYYPESETTPIGLQTVKEQLQKGVYEYSDGAVIFNGEKYGLHTRVFINSEGLPTYETKDVGLIIAKWRDYHFDESIIITANDIVEYMKVVLKSIEQFEPHLAKATKHITHGMLKLKGGMKMSSRKGNILKATDILDAAEEASQKISKQKNELVMIGAVKYALLKQRIGADIIYDPEESVSLAGNSGPYLQYAHARAYSILNKSSAKDYELVDDYQFDEWERNVVLKISEYPGITKKAAFELMPHHICVYLYELAQTFNRFYEKDRVIGSDKEPLRLILVKTYADVLSNGLGKLGIPAPDHM